MILQPPLIEEIIPELKEADKLLEPLPSILPLLNTHRSIVSDSLTSVRKPILVENLKIPVEAPTLVENLVVPTEKPTLVENLKVPADKPTLVEDLKVPEEPAKPQPEIKLLVCTKCGLLFVSFLFCLFDFLLTQILTT
jgi:hypothetical protein